MKHKIYPNLFSPIKINKMMLKNRIIAAPLGSYTDKSLGGVAMIVRGTSGGVKDSRARMSPGRYYFESKEETSKVMEQVSVIHQRGAKAEYEMCHVGQFAYVEKGDYAIGPVSYTREDGVEVRAMDQAMMEDIASKYAETAKDAKEYGFDVVMLHFAHGWLPAQFLSPLYNKRTDEYGGSFENRIKFPMMIVKKVREAVGPDYPLDMRISACEHVDGMQNPEEVGEFLHRIEEQIDMVHISCGLERELKANIYSCSPTYFPHELNVGWAKKIKEKINIPLAVVGAIMTPEEGEEIIATGAADMVVIGRALLADPFWAQKAFEGRADDIVPCIRCMRCYAQHVIEPTEGRAGISRCSVSPRYLRENRVPVKLSKAENKKRIVVVGGGPAGMKAAITASERGHEVILFEKNDKLGGQLICADYDAHKRDLKSYKDYLIGQVEKSRIKVKLNCELTPEEVDKYSPDQIVLALGATPVIPPITGVDKTTVMTALEAYEKLDSLGKHIVIVGGGSIGAELAYTLGERGHDVTVIELSDRFNGNSNAQSKAALNILLRPLTNVKIMLETSCKEIEDGKVRIERKDGSFGEIGADHVILAAGMKSRSKEANEFFGVVQDTNLIGDCRRVGTILEATEDGYFMTATV